MATALVGAIMSGVAAWGAGATATTIAMAAAIGGAASGLSEILTDTPDVVQPASIGQPVDKTLPAADAELDAPDIGDEESLKRKRQTSKEKFKVQLSSQSDTGVQVAESAPKVTGVQI